MDTNDMNRQDLIVKLLTELNDKVDTIMEKLVIQEERCFGTEKTPDSKNKVYTDEELFNLKDQLSWSKLSLRTGIPVSTLQSRCRRFRNSL